MADPQSRSGRGHWSPEIETYLRGLYAQEDPGMLDAVRTTQQAGMPEIQVAPTDGRILEVLLRMVGARRVVEVGTLAGYSAQWIARALPDDGHLWSVEASPQHASVAREVLERAGLTSKVTVLGGAGLSVLPTLESHGPFDAVFVDADKGTYADYGRWAAHNLRPGGLLIGDNAYLFGYLAGKPAEDAELAGDVTAMRAFHELLARDFVGVCIPTPDGLAVGIKK